jgi:hypothetical protein
MFVENVYERQKWLQGESTRKNRREALKHNLKLKSKQMPEKQKQDSKH